MATNLLFAQKAFAESKISVGKISQSLQQYLFRYVQIVTRWIELVQFKNCQIGFQVVGVFSWLNFDVMLESWEVFWVVPWLEIEVYKHVLCGCVR